MQKTIKCTTLEDSSVVAYIILRDGLFNKLISNWENIIGMGAITMCVKEKCLAHIMINILLSSHTLIISIRLSH